MSRSTLICWLITELCLGALVLAPHAAFAETAKERERAERCLSNCEGIKKKFESSCKKTMPNGKCDGRGKAMVDDMDKRCKEECAKRKK